MRTRQARPNSAPHQHQIPRVSDVRASQLLPQQPMTGLGYTADAVLQKKPVQGMSMASSLCPSNQTGLPDKLKSGMESVSGFNLDHVKVHYNSAKPATVMANAYAQGNEIHLASGQEQHLPHELGHVVQQMQGKVSANTTISGMSVNDDSRLEREADNLGARALKQQNGQGESGFELTQTSNSPAATSDVQSSQPVQRSALAIGGTLLAGLLTYLGKKAYNYYTTRPVRANNQPQHYNAEVATFLDGVRQTRGHPYNLQVFRVAATNGAEFQRRVRSGVRFIWALTADGRLFIASMQGTQHPIAAGNADVIGAGEGQLERSYDDETLMQGDIIADHRHNARQRRRMAMQTMLRQHAGLPGIPHVTAAELIEGARLQDEMADALQQQAVPGQVWRGNQDDRVYLNFQSGHYHPELSGRFLRSRAWPEVIAAWRRAGFQVDREPGSNMV